MKIIKNVTLYICEYCGKKYQKEHFAIKHENTCSQNPTNMDACSGCISCKEVPVTIDVEESYASYKIHTKKFFCEMYSKEMYPYKAVRKDLINKYPEDFEGQVQMPNICEDWHY
jgi:hypothetical protein